MRIALTPGGAPPAEQLHGQLRALITTGGLSGGDRLPSVRQLASDLGIAPGTVAKAYRQLEAEGLISTRVGAGTTVRSGLSTVSPAVENAARALASAAQADGLTVDAAAQILRAVW